MSQFFRGIGRAFKGVFKGVPKFLKQVAPIAGPIIGGVFGGPLGAAIGGAVGGGIAGGGRGALIGGALGYAGGAAFSGFGAQGQAADLLSQGYSEATASAILQNRGVGAAVANQAVQSAASGVAPTFLGNLGAGFKNIGSYASTQLGNLGGSLGFGGIGGAGESGGVPGALGKILPSANQIGNLGLLGNLALGGVDTYASGKRQDSLEELKKEVDPFGEYRQQFASQAANLSPQDIESDPAYQASLKAAQRRSAEQGKRLSGASTEAAANVAYNYFTQRQGQLATLGGAGISPAYRAQVGIEQANEEFNQYGYLPAALGYGGI